MAVGSSSSSLAWFSAASDSSMQTSNREAIDELVPSTKSFVNSLNQAVHIPIHVQDERPVSVPSFFLNAVENFRQKNALAFKRDGEWERWSYEVYYQIVLKAAEGFIELGLKPCESVGIICYNSPVYFASALGAIFAGGIFVEIGSWSNTTLIHVLQECKVNVMVVDNIKHINQVIEVWDSVPSLKAVIKADFGTVMNVTKPRILMWRDFLSLGDETDFSKLASRLECVAPNRCCAVFYPLKEYDQNALPNGVMMSHDNLTFTAQQMSKKFVKDFPDLNSVPEVRSVSYLPLNYTFALVLEMLVPMCYGGLVCFTGPDSMKGTLVVTLREVRPHIFCGTKDVWLLLQKRVTKRARKLNCVQWNMLVWARRRALMTFYKRLIQTNNTSVTQPGRFSKYILKKVKRKLGMSRCKLFMTYGGPMRVEILEFFISLNIPIFDTLTSLAFSSVHSMGSPDFYHIGSCGLKMDCFETKLVSTLHGWHGKLYAKGRHVCMGILHPVPLELRDSEGFMYSGVTAFKGRYDCLFVSTMSKDLLVLRNGCAVAYAAIESLFKDSLPIISNCILVGHQQKFPAFLLTLKTELNPTTFHPTTKLMPSVQRWLRQRGLDVTTVEEIIQKKCDTIYETIADAIYNVNRNLKHRSTWIRRWRMLPLDFSLIEGEIEPITMTLRRDIILRKYSDEIDAIFTS